jgi:hypothetical protein
MFDVTWNADDESLAANKTGQPRGDCPYLNNLDSVDFNFCSSSRYKGLRPRASPRLQSSLVACSKFIQLLNENDYKYVELTFYQCHQFR